MDIVERLHNFRADWDGSHMSDEAEPMPGLRCAELREAADEITRLRAQMESQMGEWLSRERKRAALEQDAARYRWLRNKGPICANRGYVGLAMFTKTESDCVALDAAIDAAMKA